MDKVLVFIPSNRKIFDWQMAVIEELKASFVVEYCLINRGNSESKLRSFLKLRNRTSRLLYRAHLVLEAKIFGLKSTKIKVQTSSIINCYPRGTRYIDILDESDCEFRALDYLFGLNFGFRIVRGEILNMFHKGLLGFHHGDPDNYRGSAPGFYEIRNKEPYAGLILQRLCDDLDGGEVLAKSFIPCHYSLGLTQNWLFEKSAILMTEYLSKNSNILNQPILQSFYRVYRFPKICDVIIYILTFYLKLIKSTLKRISEKYGSKRDWSIGYIRDGRLQTLIDSDSKYCYADPFELPDKSIVFERYNRKTRVGEIFRLNDGVKSELLSEVNCHKSYPYFIQNGKSNLIIPETGLAKKLYLLKEIDGEYRKVCEIDTPYEVYDFSVFQREEEYLGFFTTGNRGAGALYCVKMTSLEPLLVNWNKSVLVTTDERYTRCGGKVWADEKHVYRVTQQQRYGNYGNNVGLVKHDVDDLKNFRFESLLRINQNYNLLNLHTLDVFSGLIDYKKK